jgi:hypothetical protein
MMSGVDMIACTPREFNGLWTALPGHLVRRARPIDLSPTAFGWKQSGRHVVSPSVYCRMVVPHYHNRAMQISFQLSTHAKRYAGHITGHTAFTAFTKLKSDAKWSHLGIVAEIREKSALSDPRRS